MAVIYVFDGNPDTNVVCEGYSKAFQYLCDLSSFRSDQINCYTVTGTMNGGGHMWNIVRMEDGKNYLADVTNCDGTKGGTISAGFPDKLFLAGVSGTVSTGYLASLTTYYGSSREITYLYDTKTGSLYNTDVLTLSSADYTVPAATKNITDSMVALLVDAKEYDGSETERTALIAVTDGDTILKNDTDYTIVIKKDDVFVDQMKNAGTYEITVTGKGNYSGLVTKTYVIEQKSISDVTIEPVSDQYYTGDALKPELTVTDNGKKLEEDVDYTVSYSDNTEAGTAKVVITGMGNYSSAKETSFRIIEKETPTPSEPTTPPQPTTPSEPITPSQPSSPTKPSAPTIPEPSVPEQPSAPSQPSTPSQPEATVEEPEPDTLNVTVGNIKTQSYTGKGITPKIMVKDPVTRKKLKQGKHYTVSYENNVNAGTAVILIRGIEANGYSGVKHVYFTIQPQNVAKKIRAKVNGKNSCIREAN